MKNFKTMLLTLGLASSFALGACGDDMSKFEGFVDEMCKCKDQACFDKVEKKAKGELTEEKVKKLATDKPEEMGKLMGKMMECSMKFAAAEAAKEAGGE